MPLKQHKPLIAIGIVTVRVELFFVMVDHWFFFRSGRDCEKSVFLIEHVNWT